MASGVGLDKRDTPLRSQWRVSHLLKTTVDVASSVAELDQSFGSRTSEVQHSIAVQQLNIR